MFYIDLETKDNNKDIYNIKQVMHSIVEFEAPHVKRIIPQCSRCQKYNHTKNFCNKQPCCVKCAEPHYTKECPRKTRDSNVKCANCGENHPANYRGCEVHKQLQKLKFPNLRRHNARTNQDRTTTVNYVQPGITYAQATQAVNQQASNQTTTQHIPNQTNNHTDMSELKDMLKKLTEQMSTMLNLLTMILNQK